MHLEIFFPRNRQKWSLQVSLQSIDPDPHLQAKSSFPIQSSANGLVGFVSPLNPRVPAPTHHHKPLWYCHDVFPDSKVSGSCEVAHFFVTKQKPAMQVIVCFLMAWYPKSSWFSRFERWKCNSHWKPKICQGSIGHSTVVFSPCFISICGLRTYFGKIAKVGGSPLYDKI